MKPAHQRANASRVSVWALVRGWKLAGRIVTDRSRGGRATTTLTLYHMDGEQEFKIGTASGFHRPEANSLSEILRGFGFPEAGSLADAGRLNEAFAMLGLECWGVL